MSERGITPVSTSDNTFIVPLIITTPLDKVAPIYHTPKPPAPSTSLENIFSHDKTQHKKDKITHQILTDKIQHKFRLSSVARERYTCLQHKKRSKNYVADLAKTAAFWQEKPAPPSTTFCDPTHQLARCACVFITRLGTCSTGSVPGASPTLL